MTGHEDSVLLLHVDDDPEIADMTADFLEREHERFSVRTATSAEEGLEELADVAVDCIVSDYDMPETNGIEFLEAVRENFGDLPFILYTGKGSEEVASEAISAGVTEYLQKGTGSSTYKVLSNRIENVIDQRRAREEAAETERRLRTLAENSNEILWKFTGDWDELLFVNSPYEDIWGRPVDGLEDDPRSFLEGVHPGDRDHVRHAMHRLSAGTSVDVEFRVNAEEDFGRWVWVQAEPVFDDTGEVKEVVGFARDVTERKEQNRRLETLISNLPGIVYRCRNDPDWPMELVQGDAESLTGYPREALENEEVVWGEDIIHPEDREETWDNVQNALESDRPFEVTYRILTEDGSVRWMWGRGEAVDSGGYDEQILEGFITDITDRKERESELERERARLNALFQHSIYPTVFAEFEGGEPIVRDVNDAFEETFGYDEDSAIDRPIDELVVPDEAEEMENAADLNRRIKAGERVVTEVRRQTPDGVRDFLLQSTPLAPGKSGTQTYAIYRDITETKEREEALRRSEERYRRLLETAPTPIFIYSSDAELLYANEAGVEFFGAEEPGELHGTRAGTFVHPDSQPQLERRRRRLVEDREAVPPIEEKIVDPDGEEKHAILASSPVTYEGKPAIQSVATDITALKEHEKRLERYETLVEVAGDPMYMLDADGRFTYLNETAADVTGHSTEALIGESVRAVMDREHVERGERLIRSLLSSGERQGTFEMELITDDGDRIPTENHISILYEDGEYLGSVGVLRDITDRLERERQLQRERDRLDEFAGVVSHDLRNPLEVATGGLELAMEECDSEHLEMVDRAHHRMEQLLEDVLSLARAGEAIGETEAVDLRDPVEACWQNVRSGSAELVLEGDRTVRADETRLQQLLSNLLRNAVEHGGDDVRITVGPLPNGFYVEDDGPGIPPDEREEVLDPGYSTAEKGTGFGLSIVRDLAEAHGWDIRVIEGSEGGARFEITGVEIVAE